jgi:hypothetical protein
MKRKNFQKCNMDIQNAEFDADFESIEKAAKKSHEKVKEEWSF